jgi:hemerythrin-like metal-binding protein
VSPLPESLKIGITSVDEEHQALLDHLDSLMHTPGGTLDVSDFAESLSLLNRQLIDHFTSEERLMRTIGISGGQLARHIDAHNQVIEQITQLSFDLMLRKRISRDQVLAKVKVWIVGHLTEYDLLLRP